jgi:hypothetical protein
LNFTLGCSRSSDFLLVQIPTRAVTIYHFAWLRNRIANIFGGELDDDLDDIKDWHWKQVEKTPPPLPWSLIWCRVKNDVENR